MSPPMTATCSEHPICAWRNTCLHIARHPRPLLSRRTCGRRRGRVCYCTASPPGSGTDPVEAPTASIPADVTAEHGGALLPVLPEAYPLRTDHDSDPLRQVIAAGTGLRHHEHACVQILARPASPRRLARLRRAPARL